MAQRAARLCSAQWHDPARAGRGAAARGAGTLAQLERARHFATSALARTAQRATTISPPRMPAGAADRIELWGRRIGRGLSLAGFVALAIYLYFTYFADA